jgi:ATP-dependent helicase/nuclease subunit B
LKSTLNDGLQTIVEKESLDLYDSSIYFLLPDIPAINQADQLFLKQGLWGQRLLTFGKLATIANLKGERKFPELSRMGRLFLMEEVVRELTNSLSYFKEISSIKGFSESLVRLVAELKHMKLAPDNLAEIAGKLEDKELRRKLEDLRLILERYQRKLHEGEFVDDIDRLRLFSESAGRGELKNILPEAKTFVVFGFFDFTSSQLEVLKSIKDAGCELIIYLPPPGELPSLRSEVMEKMKEWLGDLEVKEIPQISKPEKNIEIHSFPSFREEAEFAAREIKRLILEKSVKPNEIAVVLRSLSEKESHLIRAFEKFGIPYSISAGVSLRTSPLGQFVINLLRIRSYDFEREPFINLLKSPFLSEFFRDIDQYEESVSELDIESRDWRILGGSKHWKELLKEFEGTEFGKSVNAIIDRIERKFSSDNLGDITQELGEILDEFRVYKAVEKLSSKSHIHHAAWEQFAGFFKEIRFLSQIRFRRSIEKIEDFSSLIEDLMSEVQFSLSTPVKGEKIRIMEAFDTRGTSFPVVFILDVGEKSFPSPLAKDPILKNDERALINATLGKNSFVVERNHYELEEFLFNLVCNSAKRKLYITYSYLDEKERSKLPSYLVEELVEKQKIGVRRYNLEDSLLEPGNIYTKNDLANHLFYVKRYGKEIFAGYLKSNWNPYRWVLDGIQAESHRLIPDGNYCCFEGIITQKELLVGRIKIPPTQLETYGDCPFRYFAGNILELEGLEEVEDEVSALDLGKLYHDVLRDLFKSLAREMRGRVDLRKVDDRRLIDKFRGLISKVDFDEKFPGITPGIRELVRIRAVDEVLPQFILAEAERIRQWNDKGFFPTHFEKELNFNIGNFQIRGKTDRIDIGREGALIIDYKRKSLLDKKFFSHNCLQLPLYLYALKKEGINPYGGYYRSVERPDEESGADREVKKDIDDLINSAISQAEMYINLINQGFFAPVIEKNKGLGFEKSQIELKKVDYSPCGYCDFSNLCRVTEGAIRRL